jgi:hypothetical protein
MGNEHKVKLKLHLLLWVDVRSLHFSRSYIHRFKELYSKASFSALLFHVLGLGFKQIVLAFFSSMN